MTVPPAGPRRAAKAGWAAFAILLFAGSAAAVSGPAQAESVSINRNKGQGFAVSHQGNCYVILPEHVHGKGRALTLSTGSPPVVGEASVFHSFAPGMDLSVAYVTGGLEGRCKDRFADLPRNIDGLIGPNGAVTYVRVSAAGAVERVVARVISMLYETMEVEVAEASDATVFRGTSGAFVFAGDTPVGMIVRAPDDRHAEVLRIDAIVGRLQRLLAGGIGGAQANPGEEPPATVVAQESGLGGKAAAITRCSAEPVSPDNGCWAMASGAAPLIVPPGSVPLVIEIELDGDVASPVSLIRIRSDVNEGAATPPKTVLVERTAGGDRPAWLSFGRGDMSPLGSLELRHGAAPRACGPPHGVERVEPRTAAPDRCDRDRVSGGQLMSGMRIVTGRPRPSTRKAPVSAPLSSRRITAEPWML